jgi:DNA adenine methylase
MAKIEPFLRWAGGKRWLARSLSPLVTTRLSEGGTYFEPFLGSGAMFFAVQPAKAVLSDLNTELVMTFKEVARHSRAIVARLARMPATKQEYERVRRWRPRSRLEMAVRFIYLNRNCYGGLYRENQQGVFNVPYGGEERNHRGICADGSILRAALLLNRPDVELCVCDFEEPLKHAGQGDVVFCDPTYREVTRRQFDRYGKIIFRWEDQERLARLASEAYRRGTVVILSNATCKEVRELYPQACAIEVKRRKGLGPTANHYGQVEYVFVLDPLQEWSMWAKLGSLKKPRASR